MSKKKKTTLLINKRHALEHPQQWRQIFSITKSHLIYFNLPFHNIPNVNGSIFLTTSFKYYFFIHHHLYLFLSLPLHLSLGNPGN